MAFFFPLFAFADFDSKQHHGFSLLECIAVLYRTLSSLRALRQALSGEIVSHPPPAGVIQYLERVYYRYSFANAVLGFATFFRFREGPLSVRLLARFLESFNN